MNKSLIILYILVLTLKSFSQTFEITLPPAEYEKCVFIKEFSDFYILGITSRGDGNKKIKSKLLKLSKSGQITDSIVYDYYYDFQIYDLIPLQENGFIVCGSYNETENDSVIIFLDRYTSDLRKEIATVSKIETTRSRYQTGQSCKQGQNSYTFIFAYDEFDESDKRGYYLFTVNSLGFIENKNFISNKHGKFNLIEDLIEFKRDTLLLFARYEIYKIDKNLNFADSISIYSFFYPQTENKGIPFDAIKINNNYIVSGTDQSNDSVVMILGLFNESVDCLSYKKINSSSIMNYKAYYHSLSAYENTAYFFGVNNFSWALLEGHYPSSLRLLKFDESLNLLWDKIYYEEDDYYYFPTVTLATKDGGNLMASTKYQIQQTDGLLRINLLKVDSLGNYIPNNIETKSFDKKQLQVYPNPGTNEINITWPANHQNASISLYSISGSKIMSIPASSTNTKINTENLAKGIYIWEVITGSTVLERGKWVKQ